MRGDFHIIRLIFSRIFTFSGFLMKLYKKIKPTTELAVAGLVNKIRRLERLRDYPSFTVASISPDFSPVLVFTKKYLRNTFGAASVTAP